MTLINSFYTVESQNIADKTAEFQIKLNAEHFIYQAHFPNNPITPGVCLIQMVVELFGLTKNTNFRLKVLKNVKFTAPISPLESSKIDFLLEFTELENLWHIKTTIKDEDKGFAKISMILV